MGLSDDEIVIMPVDVVRARVEAVRCCRIAQLFDVAKAA
jgi:hypothetical protein